MTPTPPKTPTSELRHDVQVLHVDAPPPPRAVGVVVQSVAHHRVTYREVRERDHAHSALTLNKDPRCYAVSVVGTGFC